VPAVRTPMRKIREILRLKWTADLSDRVIPGSCSIARSTVAECLKRAAKAGLSWPLPENLDDVALERRLYPPLVVIEAARVLPEWSLLQKEMKKKGVTLALLWDEYKACHPGGYHYSQSCNLYRNFLSRVDCCMRQVHVAVMGASSSSYAEATLSQSLPDWLGSHVRAFKFLGGLPEIVVPDNLRPGVSEPCRYEPQLNPSYLDLANHYDIAVMPARPAAHPSGGGRLHRNAQPSNGHSVGTNVSSWTHRRYVAADACLVQISREVETRFHTHTGECRYGPPLLYEKRDHQVNAFIPAPI
jgi:hypothetical protein